MFNSVVYTVFSIKTILQKDEPVTKTAKTSSIYKSCCRCNLCKEIGCLKSKKACILYYSNNIARAFYESEQVRAKQETYFKRCRHIIPNAIQRSN